MTETKGLETARFTLRKIEAGDIEILHSYWSDETVTKYMNLTFRTLDESRQMVALLNSLSELSEGRRWAIVDKDSGVVLGSCGYHNMKAEHRRAEIGYELGQNYWNKGIMQEVMHAVLQHCFESLRFNRIEAFVMVGNDRSVHTLEKLGFKTEGVLREYEYTKGKFQDQFIMSLIRKDWLSLAD
ncbi:MAG: GNAT family protein [Syntrophomonadaceae bacterium]|nr:GNAT family protein [Syntrophomonadaceae bacterium]MDD3024239.1 GNAT family protein [Syntrophomonadaceae bacterium]